MEGTLAEIRGFAGNFAPRNWAYCNGQLLSINQNQALFSLLGTTYGGDGRTTFGLPDLRGRVPIGQGHGPGLTDRPLGQRSGQETVTLTTLQIPSHTHFSQYTAPTFKTSVEASSEDATTGDPSDGFLASTGTRFTYAGAGDGEDLGGVTNTQLTPGSVTLSPTGGSQYHNNMQPYLVIHWVICISGLFPSRS